MSDEYQIHVPPSFYALYTDARQRLTVPLAELRERSELCEDLAQHLSERASAQHFGTGASHESVLADCLRGLQAGPVVTPDEAVWVVHRLAELLGWPFLEAGDGPANGAS
jgi:hypothetical protein